MTIEKEFLKFLNEKIAESENKNRDVNLIHYYYGFREDIKPTYDEAAKKFKVGRTEGRQTEIGSLIVENNFKNDANASDLPSAIKCSEIISSQKIISSSKLSENLRQVGLADSEINLIGLLRLLNDLKLVENYEIYTPELKKATKTDYLSSNKLFLIEKDTLAIIKNGLQKAKKLPKSIGIAKLSFLKTELGQDFNYFSELKEILKSTEDSWFHEINDETYYLIETKSGNTLINNMKRARCVSQTVDLCRLTHALRRAFLVRTAKHYEYPHTEIVKIYLKTSKYTILKGTNIELDLECNSLTPTEEKAVTLLEDYPNEKYDFLKEKLREAVDEAISDSTISNSFYNSPLVYVDESGERKDFKYSLIGESVEENLPDGEADRYAEFTQKLKDVSKDGTDREQSAKARNEQKLLRDWLFEEKDTEKCAICGEEYSKESLIAAHKKRRAECAENERRDLKIVMPLCLFGCDCMYERKYLRVREGRIVEGILPTTLTDKEKFLINSMIGKSIDARWAEGSESYFK